MPPLLICIIQNNNAIYHQHKSSFWQPLVANKEFCLICRGALSHPGLYFFYNLITIADLYMNGQSRINIVFMRLCGVSCIYF